MTKEKVALKIIYITSTVILFLISLFLPAIRMYDYDGIKYSRGYELLLIGSLSLLGGGLFEWIIWLANPLLFISILFVIRKKRSAIFISICAMCLAIAFSFKGNVLAAENGRTADIDLLLGYYLWLSSFTLWALANIIYFKYELD